MEIPQEIQELISKGLDILNSSDEAALHYSFREDLYTQIDASQPTLATKIRGLLALNAAQKVFPLATPYSTDFMDTLFEDAMVALNTYRDC
jgi:hypothetical protein